MKKINFTHFLMFTDIIHTKKRVVNIRFQLADDIYSHGSGIAFHALALKIYNSVGEVELTAEEVQLLQAYVESMGTPVMIDSLADILNTQE